MLRIQIGNTYIQSLINIRYLCPVTMLLLSKIYAILHWRNRGVATKNSLVRPRKQLIDAQRRMCMCFFEIIITIIVDIGHLNSLIKSIF